MYGLTLRMNVMEVSHELFFCRGNVIDMQGPMKEKNFDFIVDLIDMYIDLVESTQQIFGGDKNATN